MFGEISPKLRWSGKFPGITGLGTITNGAWNATPVTGQFGGTGQSSYTIGDILYASGTTALSKLAGVATGNALISGGVGTAPSWGKVGLTTHISGILAGTNGGTGVDNGTKTITLGGNLTTLGAFNTTFTVTGTTSVTLPTTGTLVAAGSSPSFTGLTIGTLSGVLKASSGVVSGSATTTDLTEGTNLYYTDARARAALSAGNGISYNSTTGAISANINATNLKITSGAIDTIQSIATSASPSFGGLAISTTGGGIASFTGSNLNCYIGVLSQDSLMFLTLGGVSGGAGYVGTSVASDFLIQTNDTERIRIVDSTGYTGFFGLSNPVKPVSIKGDGVASEWISLHNSSGTIKWHLNNNNNGFNFSESNVSDNRLFLEQGGNFGINGRSFGSGTGGVIFIGNRTAAPSSNPTAGGILYVESGALKYRGSSGTVTTIANA